MIRHDIVGVRKEKVILIVTGPDPTEVELIPQDQHEPDNLRHLS